MYKFQKKYPYYADNGLTTTSANYIANLAKEQYRTVLRELENISFYSDEESIAGFEGSYVTSRGIEPDNFVRIPEMLSKIFTLKALISWLREAIKNRQAMMDELNELSSEDYAKMKNMSCESCRSQRSYLLNADDEIAPSEKWDADEMWAYIHDTERKTAFMQAFRQFNNNLKVAENVADKMTSLEEIAADGRKLNGTFYTGMTANVDELRDLCDAIKEAYLTSSADVAPMDEKAAKQTAERQERKGKILTELERRLESYTTQLYSQTKLYKNGERSRISRMRIKIPQALQPIFDVLNAIK